MLCPECKRAAPGGASCPQCGQQIPERENFEGQGGHYLFVLSAISLLLFAVFLLIGSRGGSLPTRVYQLRDSGWIWFYLVALFAPVAVGVYYWLLLREEEISVTDQYIARRSHWGDERLAWSDLQELRRHPMLFKQTRLGRITGLSRFFTSRRLFARLPPFCYELVGKPDAQGVPHSMRLEPGTIADMPWLLQLIEERVGPPEIV